MKKTLITLIPITLPIAALADVTLYGQISVGLSTDKVENFDNGKVTNPGDYGIKFFDSGSRIGVKDGKHKINDNLDLTWNIEVRVPINKTSINPGLNYIGAKSSKYGTWYIGSLATFTGSRLLSLRYDIPKKIPGLSGYVHIVPGDSKNKAIYLANAKYKYSDFFAKYDMSLQKKPYGDKSITAAVHHIAGGYETDNGIAYIKYQYTNGFYGIDRYLKRFVTVEGDNIPFAPVRTHEIIAAAEHNLPVG